MPITFVGVGTAVAKNNGSVTPTLPSGLQANDLMLCFASARGNGTLGTPTGWTQKWQVNYGTINKIALFYKFYASGDGNPTVTYTGGSSGHTVIGQVCAFRNVNQSNPFDVQGSTSGGSGIESLNIGPITGITTGANGKLVIVFGHKADDWTSVATLTGDGLTWNEIGEPSSTLGNDAGEVWDYAISSTGSITIASKTFIVTGGINVTWVGIMQSLNEKVILTGWRKLQYFSEPPTVGQFNKLRFASEPPVGGAYNKILYEGE